jgi:hypothetical protein
MFYQVAVLFMYLFIDTVFFSPFFGWSGAESTVTQATTGILYQLRMMDYYYYYYYYYYYLSCKWGFTCGSLTVIRHNTQKYA